MPTVLRSGPFRVFFYAGDGGEPPHVHIERNDCDRDMDKIERYCDIDR
jgi:hypothetical protein